MKKIYLFTALVLLALNTNAQITGTWRLAPNPGALAVGPAQGDYSWWSNSMADVATRSCLFDDSITFDGSGGMTQYMNGNTWVELWQGATADGCATPVSPHDGATNAPFTYNYNSTSGELTVNGIGAHMGLPKVINGGELTSPAGAPSSITYLTNFSGNGDTMNLEINFGIGWWKFTYVKSSIWAIADPNVTFKVNMSDYTDPITTGVFVNGSFNSWCGSCNPMTDMGNGIWQVTLPIPAGSIEYKFTIDGWNAQENFTGTESCLDPIQDTYFNRYLQFTSDVTLPAVCFNSCDPCLTVSPELVGTWKLKEEAGSLAVGPTQGSAQWWSNALADVATRACIFDDSIKFNANGTMQHYMDGNTWLEQWQGVDPPACGSPIAPHDGTTNAPYTYSYSSATGELTTIGIGAHIGLAKVTNAGELTSPAGAPSSITYLITLSNNNNTMNADINFGGIGWWRFVYERTQPIIVADPNITFKVDMSDYTGTIGTGVFLNGTFNNWCGSCTPMTNTSGSVWEVTVPLSSGAIEYKFTIDGWNDQENFVGGESCVDTNNDEFFNRYYVVSADATLPVVCFGSCVACATGSLIENEMAISISPNPTNEEFKVTSEFVINQVELIDILGKQVKVVTANSKSLSINVQDLNKGVYTMVVYSNNGKTTNRVIVE
jgi:hypothetical protein